jgi:hypothetical protein
MVFGMDVRHIAGAALCALLTASCSSSQWKKDPNVTAGRWATSPDAAAAANTVPPRNELLYSEQPAATQPLVSTTSTQARPPRKQVKAELTGAVTIGSEASKSGSPQSNAYLDFYCGSGKGTCKVVVQVETPVSLDNEHLDLRLQKLDKSGNPIASGGTTRQAGVMQGETVTYELSAPSGKVRLSATPREGARGREGFQSRWTVRVLQFRGD